jgi:hypothetical protein
MIIDGQAAFRSLLMHHVSTHWPDAIITDFDPIAGGHLPEEFSGAGNDIILLGNELGDRQGVDIVKSFKKKPNFPAVVYFGRKDEAGPVLDRGADGFFLRNEFSHDALIVRLSDILVARRRVSSTGSLFVGDKSAGIEPLIKGYRFEKKLGTSSHSSVYLAERESTGVKMVLKVLRQIPDVNDESIAAFDRFLQEYEMIAGIDHHGVSRCRRSQAAHKRTYTGSRRRQIPAGDRERPGEDPRGRHPASRPQAGQYNAAEGQFHCVD